MYSNSSSSNSTGSTSYSSSSDGSGDVNGHYVVLSVMVVHRCVREFLHEMPRIAIFGGILYRALQIFYRNPLHPTTHLTTPETPLHPSAALSAADLTAFFLITTQFHRLMHRIRWHVERLVEEFPDIDRFMQLIQTTPSLADGRSRSSRRPTRPSRLSICCSRTSTRSS